MVILEAIAYKLYAYLVDYIYESAPSPTIILLCSPETVDYSICSPKIAKYKLLGRD